MAVAYNSSKIVTNGLVLCLDAANRQSYPGSGTTWTDLSGNGNNGTLTNGPTYTTNNAGAIVFDGSNDVVTFTYVQPEYLTTTSFSWDVWVYPTRNTYEVVVGNRGGGELIFTKLTTSAFEYYPNSTQINMPLNVWQNVCIVKNGTTITYYRNSAVISSFGSSTEKVSRPFFLAGDTTRAGENFSGRLAKVSIYNRALSAAEIQQNFNALRGRFGV